VISASALYAGVLDSNQPYYLGPTDINHHDFIRQFSEGVELRLDARYQITRSVSFRAGWSGLWLNNIARGSEMVDLHSRSRPRLLGILRDHNKDNVLMNGLEIGIDINRLIARRGHSMAHILPLGCTGIRPMGGASAASALPAPRFSVACRPVTRRGPKEN